MNLDLADEGWTGTLVPGKEYDFTITNRLPKGSYKIAVRSEYIVQPPISLGQIAPPGQASLAPDTCQVDSNIIAANSETELRAAFAKAYAEVTAACRPRIDEYRRATQNAVPGGPFVLSEGERVVIEVSRGKLDGDEPRRWKYVFGTGPEKSWLVHFGFAFTPDQNKDYYSDMVTGGDQFTITRKADRGGYRFQPVVAFTYRPPGPHDPWKPFFTAGLGANLEDTLVFVGTSWLIGDNITVFTGFAGHKQSRLKGRYHEGQIVLENLESSDLVEDTFTGSAIVGVGFRFDKNPFARETPGAQPQATPTYTATATRTPTPSPTATPTPTPTPTRAQAQ